MVWLYILYHKVITLSQVTRSNDQSQFDDFKKSMPSVIKPTAPVTSTVHTLDFAVD